MTIMSSFKTFRKYGLSFVLQHSFCCILPLLGALLGANILPFHNPLLELCLAVGGTILGVAVDDYLHKKDIHNCACHDDEQTQGQEKTHAHSHGHHGEHGHGHHHHHDTETAPLSFLREKGTTLFKKYAFPFIFAFAIWGLHQIFFHKEQSHTDHPHNHKPIEETMNK